MWVVRLVRPLPGIRAEVFVFHSQAEAFEFASCVHSRFAEHHPETVTEQAGAATDVFESWSF